MTTVTTSYDEHWRAPLRVWAAALVVALVAAATLHAGADGIARAVVPYVLFVGGTVLALLLSSRGRVRVVDGVLQVPGARIPLDQLGGVRALDREGTRQVRGPLAEPQAFIATRAWLSQSVQVQVEDPEDDTPYWLIGTRDSEALAAVLRGAAR